MTATHATINFTITAAYTNSNYVGRRTELYYGKGKTRREAERKAVATIERLSAKHGGSFTDYRAEWPA